MLSGSTTLLVLGQVFNGFYEHYVQPGKGQCSTNKRANVFMMKEGALNHFSQVSSEYQTVQSEQCLG